MIEIHMLGPTMVRVTGEGGQPIKLSTKPRQILEMLALDVGLPVTKDRLAEGIWDGQPPSAYVGTLESYVCVLRRRLGIHRGRAGALATTANGYVLDPELVTVDVAEVRADLRQSLVTSGPERVRLAEGLLQHRFEDLLVSEPYAAWADAARRDLANLVHDCFTDAACTANEMGEPVRAARLAGAAVRLGDVREAAWLQLMTGLWRSGQTSDALRAYGRLRRTLRDELGVGPGQEAQDLYLRILRDQPSTNDRQEVRTLLNLLKQAIAGLPRLDTFVDEPELRAVAEVFARQAV